MKKETNNDWNTQSGFPLKPFYAVSDLPPHSKEELPGKYPYTRAITEEMYREKLWDVGTYTGMGSSREANERYRYIYEQQGAGTTIRIAMDLPTQLGLDADDPLAYAEVGKAGVSISSLKDMEELFEGIPIDQVRLATVGNSIGPIALALFIALARKQEVPLEDTLINLQNDPLKEYTGRGTQIYPVKHAVKLAADAIEYCVKNIPHWEPISVCGSQMRWGGATVREELGFGISNAIAYVEETINRGIEADHVLPLVHLHYVTDIDFIEEIAKFRALRYLWATVMNKRFNAENPNSLQAKIQTYTAGYSLTAQQPLNNIVRIAIETLASVLGGVQDLNLASYDEASSIPTKESVTVAMRTQQIIIEEAGVIGVADPLGGSYLIENLTKRIADEALAVIEKIDSMGGAIAAIESGYMQKVIEDEAYKRQLEIENNERIVVGVNKYISDDYTVPAAQKTSKEAKDKQIKRLKELKENRDSSVVAKQLQELEEAAGAGENVVPYLIDCMMNYITIGEINQVLSKVYGRYQEKATYI